MWKHRQPKSIWLYILSTATSYFQCWIHFLLPVVFLSLPTLISPSFSSLTLPHLPWPWILVTHLPTVVGSTPACRLSNLFICLGEWVALQLGKFQDTFLGGGGSVVVYSFHCSHLCHKFLYYFLILYFCFQTLLKFPVDCTQFSAGFTSHVLWSQWHNSGAYFATALFLVMGENVWLFWHHFVRLI